MATRYVFAGEDYASMDGPALAAAIDGKRKELFDMRVENRPGPPEDDVQEQRRAQPQEGHRAHDALPRGEAGVGLAERRAPRAGERSARAQGGKVGAGGARRAW